MKKMYVRDFKIRLHTCTFRSKINCRYNNKAVIHLRKPERIAKESLRIDNYDFETSKLYYVFANLGYKTMIIVDKLGNPLYEFNIIERR